MNEILVDKLLESIVNGMYDTKTAVLDLDEEFSSEPDFYDSPKMSQQVGNVRFDQNKGIGATGHNGNIRYEGFVIYMKPQEFLKLNPYRSKAIENLPKIHQMLHVEKKPMASPFLLARWNNKEKFWKVEGHEGRGRSMSLHAAQPDVEIPVHVIPRGQEEEIRARHLTPEMVNAAFIPDDRAIHDTERGWKPAPFFRKRKVEVATTKHTLADEDPFPRQSAFRED